MSRDADLARIAERERRREQLESRVEEKVASANLSLQAALEWGETDVGLALEEARHAVHELEIAAVSQERLDNA